MADFKALTQQSGVATNIQDANSLIGGAGIKGVAGAAFDVTGAVGASFIATTSAAAIRSDDGTGVRIGSGGTVRVVVTNTGAEFGAGVGITTLAGAGAFNFSNATGIFSTSTGAATFNGSTNTFTNVINADGGVQRSSSGGMSIGTTANTTTITVGRTGQLVQVAGNFQVDGTETIVGISTFQANAIFEGNVTLGNAATDTVTFTGRVATDIHFLKEVNHTIDVDTSTTGATAGGTLTVRSGSGVAAAAAVAGGDGGATTFTSGNGGAASTTAGGVPGQGGLSRLQGGTGGAGAASTNGGADGGRIQIVGGVGGAGGAATTAGAGAPIQITGGAAGANGGGGGASGGDVIIKGGTATTGGTDGILSLGTSNTAAVDIGASGITTTVTGNLTQVTGAVSLTANAASSFTTSVGALTLTAAAASTWKTSVGLLTLEGAAGIQLNGAAATSYLTVGATANRIVIQSGIELETIGTGMIDLPSLFKINNTAVGATVTAANLGTLTNGSNADALHVHAAAAATTVTVSGTVNAATLAIVAIGSPVVFANDGGSPRVFNADSDAAGRVTVVGLATTAAGLGAAVSVQVAGELLTANGAWDPTFPNATTDVGSRVYLSEIAGKLTLTAPSTSGATVLRVGHVTVGGTGTTKVAIAVGEPFVV